MGHSAQSRRVVAVDLDGTLINSDVLAESIFLFIRRYPLSILRLLLWFLQGKVQLKRKLAESVLPDFSTLPYNSDLLDWVKEQGRQGAFLVLATASEDRVAKGVGNFLGIFDEVVGTTHTNLSSERKRDELVERYGPRGFEYVGNSSADITVWEAASVTHVANASARVLRQAQSLGRMGRLFENKQAYFYGWRRALRLHQWAKNLLIFVPLLAAQRVMDLNLLYQAVVAFLCFGACASSVYLLNDLLDLPDDRLHRTKKRRPLAAGTFPILHAMIWTPALLIVSFGLAAWLLPWRFVLVLLCYYILTSLYSLYLKKIVMLDVVTLSMLYTVRVIAGTAAIAHTTTFWILAFCMFLFLSLAFVKRYTELYESRAKGVDEKSPGRGYVGADFEILASLGAAAGYLSVLVLALYINDGAVQSLYKNPQWMWLACPLLLFWLSRVWLIAHRGEMHDDPIVFALRDTVSRWIGVLLCAAFLCATL